MKIAAVRGKTRESAHNDAREKEMNMKKTTTYATQWRRRFLGSSGSKLVPFGIKF